MLPSPLGIVSIRRGSNARAPESVTSLKKKGGLGIAVSAEYEPAFDNHVELCETPYGNGKAP
jgi:hypothetical protein